MSFPVINHLDDVLKVIEGNENFSVNQKADYIVIDYILNTPDLFNDPIERECRGIIFSAESGKLLSRPFHKFFNLNERPETRSKNLDLSQPHVILEKLDGSMIRPFMSEGKLVWGSKAGLTFLSPQVEEFVKHNSKYEKFAKMSLVWHTTPIFEWCSRKNRIVIDYPEDRLVLVAVRYNKSGEYFSYDEMQRLGDRYGIEVVDQRPCTIIDMNYFYLNVRNIVGEEGYVVRFDDGHMVKIKFDEYLRHHRAKDDINLEKNVVNILINNQADDFRTLLSEFDRARFEEFEKDFDHCLHSTLGKYALYHENFNFKRCLRKDFAITSNDWKDQIIRAFVFDYWNEGLLAPSEIHQWIVDMIKKNCGSQTGIDKVRHLFGGINWNDY